jgi:hypothetical protein
MNYLNCRQTMRTAGGRPFTLAESADLDTLDLASAITLTGQRMVETWTKYASQGRWIKVGLPEWWVAPRAYTDLLDEDVS